MNVNAIAPNDPTKWLCRKRNGAWWIWAPHDFFATGQAEQLCRRTELEGREP